MGRTRTSFQAGNTAALVHGGRSQRFRQKTREAEGQRIRDDVLARWPHLEAAGFMLDLLVDALCDVVHLRRVIDEHGGPVSPRGHRYRAQDEKRAREHDVMSYAASLLLPPREVARLGPAFGLTTPVQARTEQALKRLRESHARDVAELAETSRNGERAE